MTREEGNVTMKERLVTTREGQVTTEEGAFLACLNRILPRPSLTFSVSRLMTWLSLSNWLQFSAAALFPALVGAFLHPTVQPVREAFVRKKIEKFS